MTDANIADAYSRLRSAPNSDDWELVLQGSLSGAFDKLLDRLGGIEDFAQTTIANAEAPQISRIAFSSALENIVGRWQPAVPVPLSETDRILRLISAFTPRSGFHKVLGQLVRWGRFTPNNPIARAEERDLQLLALTTLQNYFPVHPIDPALFPAFNTYVAFLKNGTNTPDSMGHACKRLLELEIWTITDPAVSALIDFASEEILPALLNWLLTSNWHSRDALLSRLFARSVRQEQVRRNLESDLSKMSAYISDADMGPVLTLASGETIELWLDTSEFQEYLRGARWRSDVVAKGERTLAKLVAEVGRG